MATAQQLSDANSVLNAITRLDFAAAPFFYTGVLPWHSVSSSDKAL